MRNLIQLKKVNMKPMVTQSWSGLKNLVFLLAILATTSFNLKAQTLIANSPTDTSVCPLTVGAVYSISPAVGGWFFSLPNGGGAIASSTPTSVTVDWGNVPGTYYVAATDGVTNLLRRVWVEGDAALACDDLVNVSVNADCSALITPNVILEGNRYPEDSYVVTVYNPNGTIVPGNLVTGAHVDKQLRVHVRHICTGITCWGYIKVEDKFLPNLVCPDTIEISCNDAVGPEALGYPLPIGAVVTPKPGVTNCFIVTNFDLCCDVELCYQDVYVKNGCNSPIYAQYTRHWVAKDCKNNVKSCSQVIIVRQGDFEEIRCPLNHDGFELPALECDDKEPAVGPYPNGWNALDNGHPSPYDYVDQHGNVIWLGTGYPLNVNCDHFAMTFKDLKIPVCGNSFKIFRSWTIFDWCSGEILTCNQLIKVVDNTPPIIACSTNFMVFPMDYYSCTGTAIVNGPDLILDCNATTLTVSYKKADPNGNPEAGDFTPVPPQDYLSGGRVRVRGLVADTNWIRYTVIDLCGNETRCVVEVIIEDNLDPVAVCDQHTVVTIGDSGVAKVFATSLDQGSFDNCEVDSILVRRMSDNCGISGDSTFAPFVKFCCEDVALSPIMVIMRVIDKNGNYNDCMVQVTVQDKIAPDITCPANVTVACTVDIYNLTIVGRATASDNCGGIDISYTDDSTGFRCATGTIRRRWVAQDPGGRFDICYQSITIIDPNPLAQNQINWPAADLTIQGCSVADAHPDRIQSFPTWSPRPCANIIRGYEDERFYNVEGFCIKILRKWRVIDWCQYDVAHPDSNGVWVFNQVIKLSNSVAPTIATISCVATSVETLSSNCEAPIQLIGYATDDCTDSTLLVWSYTIDFDNNGSVDVSANGWNASGTYRTGTHKLRWTVKDLCGNTANCDKLFTIRDAKHPTPFCKSGLITVIMGSNGMISVKAKDFNEKSEDNCTSAARLRYSFSINPNDTVRTYSCADIPNGVSRDTSIRVYVTDEAGNQEFCITVLTLQDNAANVCPNRLSGGTVSGLVSANTNAPLKGTYVELIKSNNKMGDLLTLESGYFTFLDLPMGDSYDLMPSKNDDPSNGITTADIVMIQKHILGQKNFESPYQHIAADVNNSGTISVADISELRKLILGVTTEFRNGQKSWRFVNKSFVFEEPNNPWSNNGWKEHVHIDQLQGDLSDLDFHAIKIGDLNYSARTNQAGSSSPRTAGSLVLEISEDRLEASQELLIPVYGSTLKNIAGFQLSLAYDRQNIQITGVRPGLLFLTEANVHITDENYLNISWNVDQAKTIEPNKPLFYLEASSQKAVQASELFSIRRIEMTAEAYTDELEILDLQLRNRSSGQLVEKFELYQNVPNPFSTITTIAFDAPAQAAASIKVRDMSGKLILQKSVFTKTGLNSVTIGTDELNGVSGLLYYTVETNGHSATGKMVIVK